MKIDKEISKVIKDAENRGWFLERKGSRHYIYKHEKGGCVTVSMTPSDTRAWKNIKKDFSNQEIKYGIF